jgi:hypothetical protein
MDGACSTDGSTEERPSEEGSRITLTHMLGRLEIWMRGGWKVPALAMFCSENIIRAARVTNRSAEGMVKWEMGTATATRIPGPS